jgi:hypothetical protein
MKLSFQITRWRVFLAALFVSALAYSFTLVPGGYSCDSATYLPCFFGATAGSKNPTTIFSGATPDGGVGGITRFVSGNGSPQPDGGFAAGGHLVVDVGQGAFDAGIAANATAEICPSASTCTIGANGGIVVLQGTVIGGGGWLTGLDCNFSTSATQCLDGGDTTYSICGVSGWAKKNSANEVNPMSITNGTGLSIYPTSNTTWASNLGTGNNGTAPVLTLPVSSVVSNYGFDTPLRLTIWEVACSTGAGGDRCADGLEDLTQSSSQDGGNGWQDYVDTNSATVAWKVRYYDAYYTPVTQATPAGINAYQINLQDGYSGSYQTFYMGAYDAGFPSNNAPAANAWAWGSVNRASGTTQGYWLLSNTDALDNASYPSTPAYLEIFLEAERNGSGSSLVHTIGRIKLEYQVR